MPFGTLQQWRGQDGLTRNVSVGIPSMHARIRYFKASVSAGGVSYNLLLT
jgi:hypothetical protein